MYIAGTLKNTETTKWVYKNGKIKKRITKSSTSTSTGYYDKKGRLIKIKGTTSTNKYTWKFTHDKKGWVTMEKTPHAEHKVTDCTYHKNGMPKSFTRTATLFMSRFKFNKKGLTTEVRQGNSPFALYTYTYDKMGRVKTRWGKQKINGEYVITSKTVYKYGKSKTNDKRVYFGIMNSGAAALPASDVIPGELTAYFR